MYCFGKFDGFELYMDLDPIMMLISYSYTQDAISWWDFFGLEMLLTFRE
jgi:hypothetical protein